MLLLLFYKVRNSAVIAVLQSKEQCCYCCSTKYGTVLLLLFYKVWNNAVIAVLQSMEQCCYCCSTFQNHFDLIWPCPTTFGKQFSEKNKLKSVKKPKKNHPCNQQDRSQPSHFYLHKCSRYFCIQYLFYWGQTVSINFLCFLHAVL